MYARARLRPSWGGSSPPSRTVTPVRRPRCRLPWRRSTGPPGPRRAPPAPTPMGGSRPPPIGHSDYAAVKVLQTALGGGMAGRLFAELRDRQALAYSTGAVFPARISQGFLGAHIGTAPGNAQRSEGGMRQQIGRLGPERLSEAELARAKRYLLGQFDLDRRTNARLAWYAAFFEIVGVGQHFAEAYARSVEAVTVDDVQRVARTYLSAPTVVRLDPSPREIASAPRQARCFP